MTTNNVFSIYNASAGSGKTYSLVREYLAILLASSSLFKFQELLAITFTNKAVAEMKTRIIETLEMFSQFTPGQAAPPMMEDIAQQTGMSLTEVADKSKRVLDTLLHNYAGFDVVTIDSFTQRILRTFSKDFGIPGNFEVSLDVKDLYAQAVDALIAKAGSDTAITETLVDYSLQKASDDKHWDITKDLNEISKLLQSESDREEVAQLKNYSLGDFEALKVSLLKKIAQLEHTIKEAATQTLALLETNNLTRSNITGGYFYDHIVKLKTQPLSVVFRDSKWHNEILAGTYVYSKKADGKEIIQLLEHLKSDLDSYYKKTRQWYFELKLHLDFLKYSTPLSVLSLIDRELQNIKEEENLLLISDFNQYIFTYLKNQPAAFIYERLGERYSNYFIDEFQDTSVLQWENLVPLVENALASQSNDQVPNSLLVVGDPKQSIYRWRGGEAEQFIGLATTLNPFPTTDGNFQRLERNYRSRSEIIAFNNAFFTALSSCFEDERYGTIYREDNQQKTNSLKGGYVALEFIDADTNQEADDLYPPKVLAIILDAQKRGHKLSDICILNRNNKNGSHLAHYLSSHHIEVVSPDSLLLTNASSVQYLHALLTLFAIPEDKQALYRVLEGIAKSQEIINSHAFYKTCLSLTLTDFLAFLETNYQISFSIALYESLPMYEGVEYVIRSFSIAQDVDAYLMAYLDLVHSYTTSKDGGILGFLDYWEAKKDGLSLQANTRENAVQLMTIHKSKGLEFPVVIMPYADSSIYKSSGHLWYAVNPDEYAGFPSLLCAYRKELKEVSSQGDDLYTLKHTQQQFDEINTLYVALTRAVDELHIVSRFRQIKNTPKTFSELFTYFLEAQQLFDKDKRSYFWGTPVHPVPSQKKKTTAQVPIVFQSTDKKESNIKVATKAYSSWDTDRKEAVSYGTLLHHILSEIKIPSDGAIAVKNALKKGLVTKELALKVSKQIDELLSHPSLADCFNPEHTVYNEQGIITADGSYLIPDRIEINKHNEIILIDYKTGSSQEAHEQQVNLYAYYLEKMGYTIKSKRLVYIDTEIDVNRF